MPRPNILVILTDQQRCPPPYEPDAITRWRDEELAAERALRETGVHFTRHYAMATACAPSRASLLTGQYPSLHGVTQTDGLAKGPTDDDVVWLSPTGVPTVGHWFRAGGYRTYYKGKWHASHAALDDPAGDGPLRSIDEDGVPDEDNIQAYLAADLLDSFGFSEWVGPEPHGLGRHNMGAVKDVFTADETIALLERLDADDEGTPWLSVCSFLNPHDISYFGVVGLTQGLRYHPSQVPAIPKPPTHDEDLSTKPACQQTYVDEWKRIGAPQPWIEAHRKFYFQSQRTVDEQIARVLDALRASGMHEHTIVVFSSDHGDLLGAHGGMHEKWHNAYDEAIRVPFVVAGPPVGDAPRTVDLPTSHADLVPTLLGLAGIDQDAARQTLCGTHTEARPLPGRDLSPVVLAGTAPAPEPLLFTTDDEISEGAGSGGASPFAKVAKKTGTYATVAQPNHIETVIAEVDVDGAPHLVKLSRYHDNPQFWTVPGAQDVRRHRRETTTVTEPEPDEYELYDLTTDPFEERNLAHPSLADPSSRALRERMHALLREQLDAKRLVPSSGAVPGYRPPAVGPAAPPS